MGYGDHSDLHDHGPDGYYHDREKHEADTRREHQWIQMKREIIEEDRKAIVRNPLYAAAPDMLAALKDALSTVEVLIENADDDVVVLVKSQFVRDTQSKLRDAIAKAEGK